MYRAAVIRSKEIRQGELVQTTVALNAGQGALLAIAEAPRQEGTLVGRQEEKRAPENAQLSPQAELVEWLAPRSGVHLMRPLRRSCRPVPRGTSRKRGRTLAQVL